MTKTELAEIYRGYIACLNRQDWPNLGQFVGDDAVHNGRRLGLPGYVAMLFSGLLAAASVFSILSAILVVLPRRLGTSTSLFWGAWPDHRDMFFEAALRRDERYLFDQYLENANILSAIARNKYRCVTFAFRGLMVSVIAYVLLLIAV